jgi:hypothetical protein
MIDSSLGDQAERVFRSHTENRKELEYALKMLQEPLRILDLRRRAEEQAHHASSLASPDNVSIRLHSMKIGREELLDDLWAMTKPLPEQIPVSDEANFAEDN